MSSGIFIPDLDATPDNAPPCDCGPCQDAGCNVPGVVTASTGSLDARISLGPDAYGKSAGYLRLHADQPSDEMYRPSNLTFSVSQSVTVNGTDLDITSVETPNVIAYFFPTNTGYSIFFSNRATPAQFLSSVTISNNSNINQMFITEIIGASGSPKTTQFNYSSNSGVATWDMLQGSGLKTESRAINWETTTNRTDTITLKDGSGNVATQTTNKYRVFPWGQTLVQQTLGTGTRAKTTTWAYYEDSSDTNNYSQLQQVIEPTGRWERFSYDFAGRLANHVVQFLDNATNTLDSSNRVTLTYYDDAHNIVTNIEKLVNSEIGRSYQISFAADGSGIQQRQSIRCAVSGAGIGHSANLTNSTWRDTNTWDVVKEMHPDGTMSFYTYAENTPSTGQKTTTVKTGAPNGSFNDIVDGTLTTTVVGALGELLSSTVQDVYSGGLTLDQDLYVYSDDLKRSYTVTHLDGKTENLNYACCGLDSQTNRDGVLIQHLYDSAKRHIGATQLGITTTNLLDAAGSTLQTLRVGSNGTITRLSSAAYSDNGRLLRQTNALGGITSFSDGTNGSGQTLVTNIYPDGGTRIETYREDGSLLSVGGTGAHALQYIYGVDGDGPYTTEIKVTDSGGTNEWVKTSTDMLGHAYKVVYASGSPTALSTFNTKGQLTNHIDPDGVITLYAYNAKGEQVYSVLDSNRNYTIDLSGSDRVTFTTNDVITSHSTTVRRTRNYILPTFSSNSSNLVSIVERSADGLQSWQTQYRDQTTPVVSSNRTVYGSGGNRYVTNTAPDGTFSVNNFLNGRLISVTRKDSVGIQLSSMSYGYDVHGRQSTATDARNGTTTTAFNDADLASSVTTPAPGPGQSPQTSLTYYNSMLQPTGFVNADGASVTNEYYLTGELKRNYGSRVYPCAYSYDYAGRQKTMTNWSNFNSGGGARVTTWNYDQYRGWLTSKLYAGGAAGPSYTYTSAGRLATRVWARSITTTYSYNNVGLLSAVSYSDSTPGITFSYDRQGRTASTVRNGMTDAMAYNDANELISETFSGGTLAGLAVTNAYDAYLRRTAVALDTQPSTLVNYAYDSAGRLNTVTNGNYNAVYAYLANSPLVSQITFRSNSTARMTTTKSYDFLNRLSSISSVPSASSAVSFSYSYNSANQRTRSTLADGCYWLYDYDSLGQVRSGKKYWSDQSPVAGQQFEYAHDDIGNRTQTKAGGDQNGWNMRTASYGANSLNQYTNRDVPGGVDVIGTALATNAVTVNGQTAYRKGEYFRKEVTVANSSAALWTNMITAAAGETSITGAVLVAQTPESFTYDADGNLTQDGSWTYAWDGENRLTNMTSLSSAPTASKYKLDFLYDFQGRRVQKLVSTNNGSAYFPLSTNRFVYDDWNLLAVVNPTSSLLKSFIWGLDLSGTGQGAGGVGGLLAVSDAAQGSHFFGFDGNGNVAITVAAAYGTNTANYQYGPFGEFLRRTGPLAKDNLFRFSTKCYDDESDLVYYGFRYYTPAIGRWLNNDPLGSKGGLNLKAFGHNDAVRESDAFGLCAGPECMLAKIELPDLNSLRNTHKNFCGWLQQKIRGFLDTPEDRRGWDRFVAGTANDIELTDKEMGSALGAAPPFQTEIQKQARECKTTPFYWQDRKMEVGAMVGPPWSASLGGVSIALKTSCSCRTLTWEACIFDKYDFDPEWFSTHRGVDGEIKVILVWAAQNGARCGWKEFHHKGCKEGFIAN